MRCSIFPGYNFNKRYTCGSFRFLLFALLGDLVFTMIAGGNVVGTEDSSSVGG